MLKWSLLFLVLAAAAVIIRHTAAITTKAYEATYPLFFVFLALFAVFFITGLLIRPPRI
jgi:uncharacterized membrane protein YtjA (UPF0391 family)